MTGFRVDTDELLSCRTRLADLRQDGTRIAALAEDANPEWYIWGLLGIPMAAVYWQFAGDVHDHLGLMVRSLDEQVTSLECTAQEYEAIDHAMGDELERIYGTATPGPAVAEGSGTPPAGSLSAFGVDVVRFGGVGDVPLVSTGASAYQSSVDGDLAGIASDVAILGAQGVTFYADPLHWLISAGLSFLIDVVQPLEDLLGLVTGNPERMAGEITKWHQVSGALGPLAEEIRAAATLGLAGWEGQDADTARTRLHDFADGVSGLAADVNQLAALMDIARALMDLAQQLIIGLLAQLVEWLVLTWSSAMAAAVPTAGASTAAAGAATTGQVAVTTTRAVRFIDRVVLILKQLGQIIERLMPARIATVKGAFRPPGLTGNYGNVSAGTAALSFLTDVRSYGPGLAGLGGAVLNGGDGFAGSDMSRDELTKRLDPDQ